MTLVIVIVLASISSLLVVWWAVRGNIQPVHGIEEVRHLLKPIDLQTFQNLVDPAEDMFLRRHLRGKAFRTVQRARRVATAEYLWRLAQNAGILVRAGQRARMAANAQVASAGRHLASVAVKTGDKVRVGQEIGYVGRTGLTVSAPYLHFQVVDSNGISVDPCSPALMKCTFAKSKR